MVHGERDRRRLVVVGASAGGVEALTRLVGELPHDFGAAVLIVLHVTPSGPSVLPAILMRAGALHAAHVEDGMAIEAGHIFVAPPDQHLLVEDGHMRLSHGPRESGHRPAIDALFRSAASVFHARTIGVVLSGTRDDGSAGLIEVRRQGGIGVVQAPEDALFPEMPRNAIARATPEHVLDVPGIARLLVELATVDGGNPGHGDPGTYGNGDRDEREPNEARHVDPSLPAAHEAPGELSPYTCPECGGSLWEIRDGSLIRYRCHVGHGYSEQALIAEQNGTVEAALWTALRMLQERASLLRRLSSRFADRGMTARSFEERAAAIEAQAAILSTLVQDVGALGDPLDAGAGAS